MNRRVVITREVANEIKTLLAELLEKSLVDVRGDIPFAMREVVKRFDLNSSNIIDIERQPLDGELFRDELINTLLDSTYIDHYIQYIDAFALQDALQRIRGLFESGIMSAITKAGELRSRMRDFSDLADQQFSFTDVYHNSFSDLYNSAAPKVQVSQNPAAGIIRLQGLEQNFSEPEHCNVKLSVLSMDTDLIDETDSINAYNRDMMSPYFVTAVGYGNPTNPNYGTINFAEEDGILVSLEIELAGVYPVNRVSFAQFSTAAFDVLHVYYSEKTSPEWSIYDLDEATFNTFSTDNNEIEINFDRVYARTIKIVLRQRHYLEAPVQIPMDSFLTTQEYLDYAGSTLDRIAVDGFIESDDNVAIVKEVLENVKDQVESLTYNIEPHARSYTVGVFNLKTLNVSYAQYGEYQGREEKLRGNLSSARITYNGEVDSLSGVINTAILFSVILPGNREVFLGEGITVGGDTTIHDVTTIRENMVISGGTQSVDPNYPYKFKTHFMPALTDGVPNITMYVDGADVSITPLITEVSWDGNMAEIRLDANTCNANDLYDGKIATLEYTVPYLDRHGRVYSVDEVDIIKTLGKPNIKDNTACELGDRYLYHMSGSTYISYAPDEWYACYIDGIEDTVYYAVGTGKSISMPVTSGELTGSEVAIRIGSGVFLHENVVIPPYDDFYYGAINDTAVYQSSHIHVDGKDYYTFRTSLQYVKGTIKPYVNGSFTSEFEEYTTDTPTVVQTAEMKRTIYVYVPNIGSDTVTCSYIPLDTVSDSEFAESNVAQFTNTERFTETVDKKLNLSRYVYHDNTIIRSPNFALNRGVFFLKRKYSVVYEPIAVYVNGVKATNVHDYETGGTPSFKDKVRTTDYQYYFEDGNTLVFNEDLKGSIIVYYYSLSDAFIPMVRLYRSNSFRDDQTPELYNYTILANIQRS